MNRKQIKRVGRLLNIFSIIAITFLLIHCGDNNHTNYQEREKSVNLSKTATLLSIKDISGNWRGSHTDKDLGFRLAIKLTINLDGSYKRVFFSEGDPIDSAFGKVEIFVEKEYKTDNYGENKVPTYLHGVKFHFNTEWGLRTEVYRINTSFSLIPIISFVDGEYEVVLRREEN